jgi:hypothetical protein
MMGRMIGSGVLMLLVLVTAGCEKQAGPDLHGEFKLSSQLFGVEDYYIYGYSYEESEMCRYPYAGDPVPDIINEGIRSIGGSGVVYLPGFNTPGQANGFALVGEFGSLEDATAFFEGYREVEDELQFEAVTDTVELYQVWIQLTSAGNYAKLLVTDIREFETEAGSIHNEVSLRFRYQSDGSASFPE